MADDSNGKQENALLVWDLVCKQYFDAVRNAGLQVPTLFELSERLRVFSLRYAFDKNATVTAAASQLGISRPTIYDMKHQYDIPSPVDLRKAKAVISGNGNGNGHPSESGSKPGI